MSERVRRVNDLIQEELGKIFLKEIDLPRNILVTITRVETVSNLSVAKVFISVIPDNQSERVFKILNRIIYHIQQLLNKCLNMRPIPKIVFHREDKTVQAAGVEQILEQLKKD
ncbi:30S ribosome-binding factor RbfA [Patescibacteria group bacterium]|nr:30S ribosome-binding factor RbfA [Patescibacteria group bacterium]